MTFIDWENAMFRLTILLTVLCFAGLTSCRAAMPGAVTAAGVATRFEEELRRVDMEQARLVQAGDAEGLAALFHPAYTVHAANGRLYGLDQTLTMVRNGSLARERFLRTHEAVAISGSTGVVMGLDRLETPPPLAVRGERSRRYTNVYIIENGRWRLFARHFHFVR